MLKWLILLPALIRLIFLTEKAIKGKGTGAEKKGQVLAAITALINLLDSAGVINPPTTAEVIAQVSEFTDLLVDFFNRHQIFPAQHEGR